MSAEKRRDIWKLVNTFFEDGRFMKYFEKCLLTNKSLDSAKFANIKVLKNYKNLKFL